MYNFKTLKDFNFQHKRVLVRLDLNVPILDGKIIDETRIDKSLPTLLYLIKNNARIIVLSHLGRPKGQPKEDLSLKPVAIALEKTLNTKVLFSPNCIGSDVRQLTSELLDGQVLLIENIRFFPEEEINCPHFSESLANLADLFVNDAFSCSHRAHASTVGVTKYIPSCAGVLMRDELEALSNLLKKPKRPIAAVIGGSKISTKMKVLNYLTASVDYLIIGGGMANNFLLAQGIFIGLSVCEKNMINAARQIIDLALERNCKIILPIDAKISDRLENHAKMSVANVKSIPEGSMILDIGPKTQKVISSCLTDCKTVIWNGPLGAFEFKPFDEGTNFVARILAKRTSENKLRSVAGGGDTIAALKNAKVIKNLSYVSSAGGAFLEWLEGESLPGVEALKIGICKK